MSNTSNTIKKILTCILLAAVCVLAPMPTLASNAPAGSGVVTQDSTPGDTITPPSTPALKSVASNSSRSMTVKWNSVANCDGYRIQYSQSNSFSNPVDCFVTGNSNTSKVVELPKKGVRLYIRICAYKGNEEKTFSNWSDIRSVEIPKAVLFFASDYQKERVKNASVPKKTLDSILSAVYHDGYQVDKAILCGDYTNEPKKYNYNENPNAAIKEIRSIFKKKDKTLKDDQFIFVQGNHDQRTKSITPDGLYDCGDYLVYVLNTQSMNPWCQGLRKEKKTVQKAASKLKKDLKKLSDRKEKRPVIIATHVPLHYSGRTGTGVKKTKTGDNMYNAALFKVLNDAGKKLNIVYLFGHNHSDTWDSYLGGGSVFLRKGQKILIPKAAKKAWTDKHTIETLNFTYLNAGYLGYSKSKADNTLTSVVCKVYGDRIEFARYDKKGPHTLWASGKSVDKLVPKKYNATSCNVTKLTVKLK